MANTNINTTQFEGWTEALIRDTLLNRTNPNTIRQALSIKESIQTVLDLLPEGDLPGWLQNSLTELLVTYIDVLNNVTTGDSDSTNQKFNDFRMSFINGVKSTYYPVTSYPLPFLENYLKTDMLSRMVPELNSIKERVDKALFDAKSQITNEIGLIKKETDDLLSSASSTLSLLNKETGKIAVEKYAEIFENQAEEHSKFSRKGLGKAQWWLVFAILIFAFLIILFFKLDSIFSVKGAASFTPEVIVHVVGRFLLISLFIFIVSFSFKQFRINMHLYTLNKHRANTLKSFEYLTRAPDKLEPSSYNAILMEVAKAIYESGQTGYININDSQTDMPSIIDLSKIITQHRTP